jgi:NAD(P)H-dependent FMN reductase
MMNNTKKVIAIVGSYRKGGIVDQAVDEILVSVKEEGAEIEKIYLIDKHIEFCTNCRNCTQEEGRQRGNCPTRDEMSDLLDAIERADAIVLASPMNFYTVTAVTKRFIERLVCYAYWPWGMPAPKMRDERKDKRAIIVASSAAPAILARLTTKLVSLLRTTVELLRAKVTGVLFLGLSAREQHQKISERTKKKARLLGKKLVSR